jgi:PIN domain nuclease of toxin-antitoxin system
MKYLLDTHIVLWTAMSPQKLSNSIKAIILDQTAHKYVSIVSAWEFEIKRNLNKIYIENGIDGFFQIIYENGFILLGVEKEYVRQLSLLPSYHNDPFDRMLIATAIVEEMCLVTMDEKIKQYLFE